MQMVRQVNLYVGAKVNIVFVCVRLYLRESVCVYVCAFVSVREIICLPVRTCVRV